jgi:hypothetical protein
VNTNVCHIQFPPTCWSSIRFLVACSLLACAPLLNAQSQPAVSPAPAPADEESGRLADGYRVQQSIEFGGRVADLSGSSALWNTFVNLHSGPRLLNYELQMHAVDHRGLLFDDLSSSSFGYGGDPNNVSMFRMLKNKWYNFSASFRRDRNYWDYNLLANPLNPTGSNPAVPITSSPHAFNTVRRMGNYSLTLAPSSPLTVRLGFNHNASEGPTFSSFHDGTEVLLFQNWRNHLYTFQAGFDLKIIPRTTISYDQFVAKQKGDTSQNDAAFGYQLSNGTPVDLGLVFNTLAGQPCATPITNPATTPPTANPTCNGYLAYNRSANVRTLLPTEQFAFASNYFKKIEFSGRLAYSAGTSDSSDYNEFLQGLSSRTRERQYLITGPTTVRRINVSSDLGLTWRIADKLNLNEAFRWSDARLPGHFDLLNNSLYGPSLLIAPNAFSAATCPAPFTAAACPQHTSSSAADVTTTSYERYLGQDLKQNTVELDYDVTRHIGVRLGYRYRNRFIQQRTDDVTNYVFFPTLAKRGACASNPLRPDGTCLASAVVSDEQGTEINEHSLLFGFNTHARDTFRLNYDMELMYADKVFTRISPRQSQHYKLRASFKPVSWLSLTTALNVLEKRNNVTDVNNLQHNRNYAFTATVLQHENWGLDLNYSFNDVFSQTNICFVATPTTPNTTSCGAPFLEGISFYQSNTHFVAAHLMWKPVRRVTTQVGYTVDAVNGSTLILNPLAPLGPLQFNYHQPSAEFAYELQKNWTWRAGWNYYGYNEKGDPGFTAPRDFRGNVVTLALRYAF